MKAEPSASEKQTAQNYLADKSSLYDDVYFSRLKKLGDDFMFALIDNPYECPIVIDNAGRICYMSRFSKKLIGIDPDEYIGKHIVEIIGDTKLHEVLDGKARIADLLNIGGKQQVISRLPLRDTQGRILGAVGKGVFNEASKVIELGKRVEILKNRLQYFQNRVSRLKGGPLIIGTSKEMNALKETATQAASCDSNVLITGESGTGKEMVAQFVHQSSCRSKGPFICVNCASIPQELFESELFGYESGAFTGALSKGKPGRFELADGGTILLDEIGDLPLSMQVKLLRVLEEHKIDRLGGVKPIPVNFRLIAATNRDLQKMVNDGSFRMDLYYRINILHIPTPSLRSIPEDIPLLVEHLMAVLREDMGTPNVTISYEAMEALKLYNWPGNVRELRNVLERALIFSKGKTINIEDLPIHLQRLDTQSRSGSYARTGTLKQILKDTERKVIEDTLASTGGNKAKAARLLGIHRITLYEKLKSFEEAAPVK